MRFNKTVLACAVVGSLGMSAVAAEAAPVDVVDWDLTNMDGDGLRSDFAFFAIPTGSTGNIFGFTPETGCTNAPGGNCVAITMNGTAIAGDVFTTGFNFGGTGFFKPNITTGGADATIDTSLSGGQQLQFSALNFGGTFPGLGGTQFFLAPNVLSNCSGTAGCGASAGVGYNVETFTDLGGGNYGVVVRYVSTITGTGTTFDNFQANWRLEGIMTTEAPIPIPAAVWLFGSGLLGLVGIARRKKKA